jgi:hypothetical protein
MDFFFVASMQTSAQYIASASQISHPTLRREPSYWLNRMLKCSQRILKIIAK